MRVGTYYFIQAPKGRDTSQIIREEVDQMVLSEELGFDTVWLTEHHYSDYGLSSAASVLAATVAARTSRIKIATAIYVLPFHHPLRLAEETATLDILSNGRLIVGLGRGNRPKEFYGHQMTPEESRSRFEEGFELLIQGWTQETVSFHGKHWDIEGISALPKPMTKPHPELAFAMTSPESIAWAAKRGYAVMNSGLNGGMEHAVRARQTYLEALESAGRTPAEIATLMDRWSISKHVYVAPTDEEAWADAEPAKRWYIDSFARSMQPVSGQALSDTAAAEASRRLAGRDYESLADDSMLAGSPKTVARQIAALKDAGVGEVLCWMSFGGLSPDKVRRSMELFAKEVLPAAR